MDEDNPPLEFQLGSRLVTAASAKRLDPRRTVYRLEITQSFTLTLLQRLFGVCHWLTDRWPEWFLPQTVILKQRKVDWEDEFRTEIQAYGVLKALQGIFIPRFYGVAEYGTRPALVMSEVMGRRLCDGETPESEDEDVRNKMTLALQAFQAHGVNHADPKLDNYFITADGVVIIDLEQVEFNDITCWEESTNYANMRSLMVEIDNIRNPKGREHPSTCFPPGQYEEWLRELKSQGNYQEYIKSLQTGGFDPRVRNPNYS